MTVEPTGTAAPAVAATPDVTRDLATALGTASSGDALTKRTAVVDAVNTGGTIAVKWPTGGTVDGIPYLSSYAPKIKDIVLLLGQGTDFVAIGALRAVSGNASVIDKRYDFANDVSHGAGVTGSYRDYNNFTVTQPSLVTVFATCSVRQATNNTLFAGLRVEQPTGTIKREDIVSNFTFNAPQKLVVYDEFLWYPWSGATSISIVKSVGAASGSSGTFFRFISDVYVAALL